VRLSGKDAAPKVVRIRFSARSVEFQYFAAARNENDWLVLGAETNYAPVR
jgi:hypothetical protein